MVANLDGAGPSGEAKCRKPLRAQAMRLRQSRRGGNRTEVME
ncbi:No hit [Brucella canis HSK A52141]|nr:No hit [Brucella canis HSK A52141]